MSAVKIGIAALLASSPVIAIVGQKIEPFPGRPTTPPPRIMVGLVSEGQGYHGGGADKLFDARVSIHCTTTDAGAAHDLGEAVKLALDDFDGTIDGCIAKIFKESSDFTDYSDDMTIHRRVMDYRIWWRFA